LSFLIIGDLSKVKRVFFYFPFTKVYLRKVLEIRFCRMLAILLDSGIELPKALLISKKSLGNNIFLPSFAESYKAIIDGEEISKAISLNNNLFSETTIEYIGIGEKSGNLVEMLKNAAKNVEEELEADLVKFKVMLEPIMLILVSVLVILVVYSIAKPVITLFNSTPGYS
jgi:type II secretory pathway component PulF